VDRVTSFAVRLMPTIGGHATVRLYAGPRPGARAYLGSLTMRPAEARDLVELLVATQKVEVLES
jgi:hypothetical protein